VILLWNMICARTGRQTLTTEGTKGKACKRRK